MWPELIPPDVVAGGLGDPVEPPQQNAGHDRCVLRLDAFEQTHHDLGIHVDRVRLVNLVERGPQVGGGGQRMDAEQQGEGIGDQIRRVRGDSHGKGGQSARERHDVQQRPTDSIHHGRRQRFLVGQSDGRGHHVGEQTKVVLVDDEFEPGTPQCVLHTAATTRRAPTWIHRKRESTPTGRDARIPPFGATEGAAYCG